MCNVLLPPGVNKIAVKIYINIKILFPNYPLQKFVHASTFFNIYLVQMKEKEEDGRPIMRAMVRVELNLAAKRC
jgi:hypothetical protein